MSERDRSACHDEARWEPVIDRNRCEAKADCVAVCPYDVFAIERLRPEDKAALRGLGRVKAFFHGYQQAYAVRADACHGCGLCVKACPEKAIKLRARTPG
ncbi:MAG: ferredoxin family protein [Myxococcales bacterium]|nr:ferredoxin family protein [Myxococcales bacterium]MCB9545501.1 ferredoxin family protein [Myxococcales bacterium]